VITIAGVVDAALPSAPANPSFDGNTQMLATSLLGQVDTVVVRRMRRRLSRGVIVDVWSGQIEAR